MLFADPIIFRLRTDLHRRFARICLYTATFATCCALSTARADIVVDGVADEAEWRESQTCADWRVVAPFTRAEPRYRNSVSIAATAQGLAAFFAFEQPPLERRFRPRTPRDAKSLTGESVTLLVDFDANGQIAYEFSVGLGGGVRDGIVTNQNEFDTDWDGVWQRAIRETEDQWFVELLIPWSSITMRNSKAERRAIGIYAARYLYDRAEEFACPGLDDKAAVFVSDFRRVEIEQHDGAAQFDFVPYASLLSDQVADTTKYKIGADINWKPSSQLWLTAALNPDFGQVESDELVVDFSAIETVFTDKRPFFTENQAIFDLRTPSNGQLIYTRRIGAVSDDGLRAASDIDVGLKVTGTAARLVYGAFAAQEDDHDQDIGRFFAATRLALPLDHVRIGHLATYTQRPLFERDALINALDLEVTPNDWWRLAVQGVRSDIDVSDMRSYGYLGWAQLDMNRSAPLTHSLKLLYTDERFNLNDMGYMERNALRQVEWETNRRLAGRPGHRIAGEAQRFYLQYRENTAGERLPARLQVSRDVQYTSAWRAYEELRILPGGNDDLISRGNGAVRIRDRYAAYVDVTTPRFGNSNYTLGLYVFQQGIEDLSAYVFLQAAWFPFEELTLRTLVRPQWSDDWLLWERDNNLGSYTAERLDLDLRVDWIPSTRHELRIKLQWIGIRAEPKKAYRAEPDGRLLQSSDTLRPFSVSNFGLQIRYRYEIAPMSELFVVYGRGGFDMLNDDERDVPSLLGHIADVRDAEQVLIKLRYRL
jgi:Domain of unknown function (DUF5916)